MPCIVEAEMRVAMALTGCTRIDAIGLEVLLNPRGGGFISTL